VVGSPERIAEAVKTNVVDVGIDGVIINIPAYVPGWITKVGEALRPVLGIRPGATPESRTTTV